MEIPIQSGQELLGNNPLLSWLLHMENSLERSKFLELASTGTRAGGDAISELGSSIVQANLLCEEMDLQMDAYKRTSKRKLTL